MLKRLAAILTVLCMLFSAVLSFADEWDDDDEFGDDELDDDDFENEKDDKDFRTIGEKRILNMVRYITSKREKIMYRDL